MTILVTGGAGFIGTNFVHDWLASSDEALVNVDKLTYAGNESNLDGLAIDAAYRFIKGDICDGAHIAKLLAQHSPRAIIHFAAETHVDRSITGPEQFVHTNVVGTFRLLENARIYRDGLTESERSRFRFLHISTDEVYGSLGPGDAAFTERSPYAPNSPYSASKAAADHFVRAYSNTYGLPVLTSVCSNNFGPYQHPEKLIPLMIQRCLDGEALPVYGDGSNIRDWIYVSDHCAALRSILERGVPGRVFNVGGGNELPNTEVVRMICSILDEIHPGSPVVPHAELITNVADRPGHDRRYAVCTDKIQAELGWLAKESFSTGLRKTVSWYLENREWLENAGKRSELD